MAINPWGVVEATERYAADPFALSVALGRIGYQPAQPPTNIINQIGTGISDFLSSWNTTAQTVTTDISGGVGSAIGGVGTGVAGTGVMVASQGITQLAIVGAALYFLRKKGVL